MVNCARSVRPRVKVVWVLLEVVQQESIPQKSSGLPLSSSKHQSLGPKIPGSDDVEDDTLSSLKHVPQQ